MNISVSDLEARLLEIVREVERDGTTIDIERDGQIVARMTPAASRAASSRPWEALHGTGVLNGEPEESVLQDAPRSIR